MAYPEAGSGEGPISESLRQVLADDFFEVVEIAWIKDAAERAKVKALLASSGVEAIYGCHPRLLGPRHDLNAADPAVRAAAVQAVRAGLDEAHELGLASLGLLSGFDVEAARRPAAMDLLVESLNELCAYAAPRGLAIVLEQFDRDIDKKRLIGPAPLAAELARRVRATHANFSLLVDLSHIVLLGETPEQALVPVREFLGHVHIGNAYFGSNRSDPYWGDHHPSFGYPGSANGVPELVRFLQVLCEIGYLDPTGKRRGAVSFEIKPLGGIDSRVMIANAKRALREAWRLVVRQSP